MIGELSAYAFLVFACPAVWAGQHIRDWWREPNRAYFRGLWIADHMHPRLQAEAQSAWTQRGSAEPPSSVEPQPAPGTPATLPGAGPDSRSTPLTPDTASTGVQPRNREGLWVHEPGASDPETGAPVRGAA